MREIKFRAWDTFHNEMVLAFHPSFGVKGYTTSLVDDDLIIMQFTGLKDNIGKEIYEGDIVENNTHRFKLEWRDDGCYYLVAENEEAYIFLDEAKHSTVIGNIYENPELLK